MYGRHKLPASHSRPAAPSQRAQPDLSPRVPSRSGMKVGDRVGLSQVSFWHMRRLTRPFNLVSISSRLDTAYRATDCTSSGSNFAESSSFATARAMLTPSEIPGGAREPPENAWPTTSLRRLDERDR